MSVEAGLDSGVMSPPSGKPPKTGRRKISLPWFRQSSFGERLTKLRLPRQHTVDCSSTVAVSQPSSRSSTPTGGSRSASIMSTGFKWTRKSNSASLEEVKI